MIQLPDSSSSGPDRAHDLPDFTDPPLNEVVLSIQFATLANLKSVHVGLLWERLRSEYPNVTEQVPLQAMFETFGVPSQQAPFMQIQTLFIPPLPRYWFERPGSPDLLQIQQDRIVHNWRQHSDNSRVYPRYETVRGTFEREMKAFLAWLYSESIGELRPNQCEVSYINLITLPSKEDIVHSRIESITPIWAGVFSEPPPNKLERANIQMTFLFSDEERTAGRVYVNFQSAFRSSDGTPVVRLDITARGRPKSETVEDAFAFLDLEREQVVRTFAAVTTTEMHKLWGRTDGQR